MSTQAASQSRYEVPAAVAPFVGEINDVDGHEALSVGSWVEEFGSVLAPLRDACAQINAQHRGKDFIGDAADIAPTVDDAPITAHNVWHLKDAAAPGSTDMQRRIEVLDFVGVKRQIMFPGGGPVFAHALLSKHDDPTIFPSITGDRRRIATEMIDACNQWSVRLAREQDRIRPAAILVGDTPDELYDRLHKLIEGGVRQVMIAPDTPPGGVSPAAPVLDRLWALAADGDCSILAHIAISESFPKTLVWRDAPAFKGWMLGGEFSLDPWTLSNIHLAVQNYLMTMVMGGVFERHPRLRFGTAEFTGHWIGPLADNLDRWAVNTPFVANRGDLGLKLKPSEYIRRNVRVAAFEFEPVGQYIDHFGLEEVYCFASDFPHHEGGKDPMGKFVKSLEGKSDELLRKFFITNGAWLLPD